MKKKCYSKVTNINKEAIGLPGRISHEPPLPYFVPLSGVGGNWEHPKGGREDSQGNVIFMWTCESFKRVSVATDNSEFNQFWIWEIH